MLVHYALHQLTDYVNWTFFLFAWNIKPKFATVADVLATHDCPACREGWISGFPEEEQAEARETLRLYLDAQDRLRRLDEAGIKVHALFRRFPAYSEGDNIIVTHPDGSTLTLPFLRQQHQQTDRPNLCLSDFIAPKGYVDADHVADDLGAFAVSVDTVPELDNPDDPYERMLIQVLLDRMAEAATERFHQDIRTTHWGYAPHEALTKADLLAERYQGIRPAVGYPPRQRGHLPPRKRDDAPPRLGERTGVCPPRFPLFRHWTGQRRTTLRLCPTPRHHSRTNAQIRTQEMNLLTLLYRLYQLVFIAPFFLLTTFLTAFFTAFGCMLGLSRWFAFTPSKLWGWTLIRALFIPVTVEGRHHLQPGQSYVFVANHQGAFDIFFLSGFLGREFKWMMKQSLRRIPLVGYACEKAGFIFVDKSTRQGIVNTMRTAKARLQGGTSLAVFPEGARSFTGHMGDFRRGAFQLADTLQLPVVPITLDGCFDLLPRMRGFGFVTWHPLRMVIHAPIAPIGKGADNQKHLLDESYRVIMAALPERHQGYVKNPDQ